MHSKANFLIGAMLLAATTVGYTQPNITNQPQTLAVAPGTAATFTIGASGTGPLAYQWQINFGVGFSDLANRTNASLVLANVQAWDATDYRVVVTNLGGARTSAVAHLYVMEPGLLTNSVVLDNFNDNRLTSWTAYGGGGSLIESNQQFTVRGYWPGQRTLSTYDTFLLGALSTSYRTVGQGQTVEWRVDWWGWTRMPQMR